MSAVATRVAGVSTSVILMASCGATDMNAPYLASAVVNFVILTPTARPGDYVSIDVQNVGAAGIAMGQCPDQLQHFTGTGWNVVSSFDPSCDLVLLIVQPGASTRATLSLPTGIGQGLYRARFTRIRTVDTSEHVGELIGDRYSSIVTVER